MINYSKKYYRGVYLVHVCPELNCGKIMWNFDYSAGVNSDNVGGDSNLVCSHYYILNGLNSYYKYE